MRGSLLDCAGKLERRYPVWEPCTIWTRFCVAASLYPYREFAVLDTSVRYTYEDTYRLCMEVASKLSSLGVGRGTRVAAKLADSFSLIVFSLALAKLRATKVSVSMGVGPFELSHIVRTSFASVLVSDCEATFGGAAVPACLKRVVILAGGSTDAQGVCVWDSVTSADACAKGTLPHVTLQAEQPVSIAHFGFDPIDQADCAQEVSDIMFTSGSTGNPKGVMLSHDMLERAAFGNCLNRGFEDGRRVYVPLPLTHVYGYVEGFLAVLFVGGTLLLTSKKADARRALEFMREECANDLLTVPSAAAKYLETLEEHPMEFPDLHAVYCSASSCPQWIWPAIRERFGVDDVITGYGMTEVAGATLQTRPFDNDETLSTRVGRLLPSGCSGAPCLGGNQVEYRVVDPESGRACAPGVAGELWCRGLTVTRGYCDAPEANVASFAAGGWFKTGDAGYFDDEGYLVLSGRLSDSYKINGENVSPSFVEQVVGQFADVDTVQIVGVPNAKLGAVGAAFVQLKTDTREVREGFEGYCRENLARFQVPKYYFYIDKQMWPKTATGKVKRADLKAMALRLLKNDALARR